MEKIFSKADLINWLLPNLKDKNRFFKLQKNNYFKYLKEEDIFQFFVVNLLRENNYNVIILGKESAKSHFEKYKFTALCNLAGRADIFVTRCNTSKGCFFELKKGISVVYTRKLKLRKSEHLERQNAFLEKVEKDGYVGLFLYPENLVDNLDMLFDIKIKDHS